MEIIIIIILLLILILPNLYLILTLIRDINKLIESGGKDDV